MSLRTGGAPPGNLFQEELPPSDSSHNLLIPALVIGIAFIVAALLLFVVKFGSFVENKNKTKDYDSDLSEDELSMPEEPFLVADNEANKDEFNFSEANFCGIANVMANELMTSEKQNERAWGGVHFMPCGCSSLRWCGQYTHTKKSKKVTKPK